MSLLGDVTLRVLPGGDPSSFKAEYSNDPTTDPIFDNPN